MSQVDRKQIAKLLAEGMPPVEISQCLGMSPSHLSQVMNDETFLMLVEEYKAVISLGEDLNEATARDEFHKELDNFWDDIEALSIDKLKENLAVGLVTKTSELLSIAAVANKAVRKKHGSQRALASTGQTVVSLNISNVLVSRGEITQTELNSANQVIEVEGRSIVNAHKDSIFSKLESLKKGKELLYENSKPKQIAAEDL